MRTLLSLIALVFASQAYAEKLPMTVKCSNDKKSISIVYEQMHSAGQPRFSYTRTDSGRGIALVADEPAIETRVTPLGTLISARYLPLAIPDQQNYYVSFVLPKVNLDTTLPQVDFQTQAVETLSKTTFVGEEGVLGTVQSSQYYPLNCTASSGPILK